jgi:hypothetical protein
MRKGQLIGVGVGVAGAALAARLARGRMLHFGATSTEAATPLVGDELLGDASLVATRAITIAAPPNEVWPWLVQIGQGRAGFYSYDALENVAGSEIKSASTIVPDWQALAVGDSVRLHPQVALEVVLVQPPHSLVLRSPADGPYEFTWAFVLRATQDGATRLVVRERYRYQSPAVALMVEPLASASFVMTQKMLRGIRNRAERAAADRPPGATQPLDMVV